MAKHKKKHKKNSTSSVSTTPAGEVKAQLKRFNWKRLLIIVVSTIAAFALYRIFIDIPALRIGGIPIIMPIYIGIVTLLASAIIILNSGLSTKPITADMLKADEFDDREELEAVVAKLNERKKTAKKLMMVLLPFLFSIFFDMIFLFYGDFFSGAAEAIFGG